MITNSQLESTLNELLSTFKIKDYAPNGLQVEGRREIRKIVTGVTACQALLDAAVERQADAVLVHHGYFWKGESQVIKGMKRQRLKTLLSHDINLFGYHLPLDVHPELGNNVQLAQRLGIDITGGLEAWNPQSIALVGEFAEPVSAEQLGQRIETSLERKALVVDAGKPIKTVAWCTGGGQSFIDMATEQGIDAFISGEASEQTIHTARENQMSFFAAGHHATERYGIKALGEWLAREHQLEVEFVDIDNPV